MRRVCAWCGRLLGESDAEKKLSVTHGICPECRGKHFIKVNEQSGNVVIDEGSLFRFDGSGQNVRSEPSHRSRVNYASTT